MKLVRRYQLFKICIDWRFSVSHILSSQARRQLEDALQAERHRAETEAQASRR